MRLVLPLLVMALTACGGDGDGSAAGASSERPVAREARAVQLERPDPGDYEAGSPRRAAEAFLAAWHDEEWDRGVHWSAPLWRRGFDAPVEALSFRLGGVRLRGAYQRSLRPTGPSEAELDVLLALSEPGADAIERRPVTLDLRAERGRWSVEPSSIPSTRKGG